MKKDNKEKKVFSFLGFNIKQFIVLAIGVFIWLTGVCFLVFGLIGDYANLINNIFLNVSNNMVAFFHFGLSLTWFGVLLMIIGVIVSAFALCLASKSEERENEKVARRN